MADGKHIKAIGLMSGTSLDGIDIAWLESDGEDHIVCGAHTTIAYDTSMRQTLRHSLQLVADLPTEILGDKTAWCETLHTAEALTTDAHIKAVQDFCRQYGTPDLIGLHGQTLVHRPQARLTLQIGDAARLAQACGVDVVADFRQDDIAAGGEGAPLAPLFHAALLRQAQITPPLVVVNIGGVANLTYWDSDEVLAFDTGPGNALIDDWIAAHTDNTHDTDGQLAATGIIDHALLDRLMQHPYFVRPFPKSLDRLDFSLTAMRSVLADMSLADGAANLTALTARSIATGIAQCPAPPQQIILCGGGRHNATLCAMLAKFSGMATRACETLGWHGNALEAQAFAWLAVRSQRGLPLSLPSTTGVPTPQTGGRLFRGR